ncbi:YraN family protein [Bifidobacterium avesanii]|uniref:YraN family protein n=1 Tax=Bifidobacterium avesanii TaxID=1798157 RepID=UPI003B84553C
MAPIDAAALDLVRGRLTPRQLGRAGERYAALWLEEQGWRILDRNWRSRYGELDLIALDPRGEIVFVEVKTRRSSMQGSPQEAVDRRKQSALRRAAMEWLLDDAHYVPHQGTRFDVIAVRVASSGPQTTHIPGAF